MSRALRWDRARPMRETEPAFIKPRKPAKGGWTHLKLQPVKVFTADERARWVAEREAA